MAIGTVNSGWVTASYNTVYESAAPNLHRAAATQPPAHSSTDQARAATDLLVAVRAGLLASLKS